MSYALIYLFGAVSGIITIGYFTKEQLDHAERQLYSHESHTGSAHHGETVTGKSASVRDASVRRADNL